MDFVIAQCFNTDNPLGFGSWRIFRDVRDPAGLYRAGLRRPQVWRLHFLISTDGGETFVERIFSSEKSIATWMESLEV